MQMESPENTHEVVAVVLLGLKRVSLGKRSGAPLSSSEQEGSQAVTEARRFVAGTQRLVDRECGQCCPVEIVRLAA